LQVEQRIGAPRLSRAERGEDSADGRAMAVQLSRLSMKMVAFMATCFIESLKKRVDSREK
jgi:hypothetical protein